VVALVAVSVFSSSPQAGSIRAQARAIVFVKRISFSSPLFSWLLVLLLKFPLRERVQSVVTIGGVERVLQDPGQEVSDVSARGFWILVEHRVHLSGAEVEAPRRDFNRNSTRPLSVVAVLLIDLLEALPHHADSTVEEALRRGVSARVVGLGHVVLSLLLLFYSFRLKFSSAAQRILFRALFNKIEQDPPGIPVLEGGIPEQLLSEGVQSEPLSPHFHCASAVDDLCTELRERVFDVKHLFPSFLGWWAPHLSDCYSG
jgi:hypothetical protein